MRRTCASFVGSVATVCGMVFGSASALAEATRYDYDIYVGGSQVAVMRILVERGDDRYRIASAIDLVGLAAMFSDWSARGETRGQFRNGRPIPERFVTRNVVEGEDRVVTMEFTNGAVAQVIAEPSNADDERDAVPVSQQLGTIDPLSAVLAATLSPFDCGGDRRLFDGRRLTEVRIDGAMPSEAPPTDYGLYAGPATMCEITLQRIAGFSRRWEGETNTPSQMAVWMAQVDSDLAVPVRIESDTHWGAMRGHLVAISPQGAQ